MRIGTFAAGDGAAFVGELDGEDVAVLEADDTVGWLAGAGRGPTGGSHPLAGLRVLAPVPEPPSVRDFYAHEGHVAAGARLRGREIAPHWYEAPAFYFSNPAAIFGPGRAGDAGRRRPRPSTSSSRSPR